MAVERHGHFEFILCHYIISFANRVSTIGY